MLLSVAGVPVITDGAAVPILPTPGLIGESRPSLTYLSMWLVGVNDTNEGGGAVNFSVYVPQPFDISDANVLSLQKWMPIPAITPMDSQSIAFESAPGVWVPVRPTLTPSLLVFPNPATRLMTFSFNVGETDGEDTQFIIGLNFKHSLV